MRFSARLKVVEISMVAFKQNRKENKDRRRRSDFSARLEPVILLLLLLGIACLATYLVMDPLVHPSHHPTLVKFYTYMARFHPRLCQMSGLGLIALAALAQTCTVIGPLYLKYVVRKKGRLGVTNLKSARYLDQV
ncbi:MAG: hypothetical protein JSS86_07495, partial [Cyanobacteria bacterium SZAS LIN-2]|nr:hypothetical protein [Cyanobacteria bacterium SZAS LIN-2]